MSVSRLARSNQTSDGGGRRLGRRGHHPKVTGAARRRSPRSIAARPVSGTGRPCAAGPVSHTSRQSWPLTQNTTSSRCGPRRVVPRAISSNFHSCQRSPGIAHGSDQPPRSRPEGTTARRRSPGCPVRRRESGGPRRPGSPGGPGSAAAARSARPRAAPVARSRRGGCYARHHVRPARPAGPAGAGYAAPTPSGTTPMREHNAARSARSPNPGTAGAPTARPG